MNYFAEERGATRGLKMLLKKMAGEPFETDLPMPKFDRVEPGKAIEDLSKAKIAIVTWLERCRMVRERTLETAMKKIDPKEIRDNAMQLIGHD